MEISLLDFGEALPGGIADRATVRHVADHRVATNLAHVDDAGRKVFSRLKGIRRFRV
jgi:hypothetical protein